jgi:hypothetical protein
MCRFFSFSALMSGVFFGVRFISFRCFGNQQHQQQQQRHLQVTSDWQFRLLNVLFNNERAYAGRPPLSFNNKLTRGVFMYMGSDGFTADLRVQRHILHLVMPSQQVQQHQRMSSPNE